MLQVHVQQAPHTELLHWRLELRWSAPLPALAQRWPAGGALASTQGTNPFAANRLPLDINTTNPSGATSALAEVSRHHVLPQAPLQDIRLIGVVGQDDERVALVTWTAVSMNSSPNSSPESGRGSLSAKSHRIRLGQYLGVERTQVVAIEPQALVLQSSGPAHTGHRPGRREVLALANMSVGIDGEGVGHE
jgi:Tfp pilus assembly protein PilP